MRPNRAECPAGQTGRLFYPGPVPPHLPESESNSSLEGPETPGFKRREIFGRLKCPEAKVAVPGQQNPVFQWRMRDCRPGSRYLGMDSKRIGMHSKCLGTRSRCMGIDSKCMVVGSKCIGVRSKCSGIDSRCSGIDSRCMVVSSKRIGTRSKGIGVRSECFGRLDRSDFSLGNRAIWTAGTCHRFLQRGWPRARRPGASVDRLAEGSCKGGWPPVPNGSWLQAFQILLFPGGNGAIHPWSRVAEESLGNVLKTRHRTRFSRRRFHPSGAERQGPPPRAPAGSVRGIRRPHPCRGSAPPHNARCFRPGG